MKSLQRNITEGAVRIYICFDIIDMMQFFKYAIVNVTHK